MNRLHRLTKVTGDNPYMTQRINLVVFDLGGVLVQAGRSWTEAALALGFTMDPAWLSDFELRLSLVPRRGRGELSSEEYFERFAEVSGGMFSVADARNISHASLAGEYPGISEVFDRLEAAGIDSAALSNTSDDHWDRLFPSNGGAVEFPTLARIKYRLASHLLGIEKPDRRAYLAIEEVCGRSGASVLYFDDKAENLAPAKELGWQAVLIDHLGDPARQLLEALDSFDVSRNERLR